MKKNIGSIERILRVIIGLAILGGGLAFKSWFGLIGLLPLATAAIGWCPPYALLGICTCSTECKENSEKAS